MDTTEIEMPAGDHLPAWMGITVGRAGRTYSGNLDARPEILNYRGVFHGGTITTLADVTMAFAVATEVAPDRFAVTSSITVHFVRPASGSLVADAQTIRVGRGTALAEVTVSDASGEVVAKATGAFQVLPSARSEEAAGHHAPR